MYGPESDIEDQRREALAKYRIVGTAPEQEYDDLVLLASKICNTPIAVITFMDGDRIWIKAKVGTDLVELPRKESFCNYTVLRPEGPLVVEDTLLDETFVRNPLVTDGLGVRFYAGVPICTKSELVIGTLCVVDTKPRTLVPDQIAAIEALGRQVSVRLESRVKAASRGSW